MTDVVAHRVKKTPVVTETPAHKQGHNLLMKTEQRRKRLKLGPTDMVIAESPMKLPSDSAIPGSLPMSHLMRHSSFYSEKPSRNVSKYSKLEERMTQKVLSPPSQKFANTYVAGSWLTSPRRITPKALFGSLLSPSPSAKAGTKLPRTLNLKSPIRSIGCFTSLDFKSPVKIVVGSPASSANVASPLRPTASSLSQLGLDSPSRNTRSHTPAGKQGPQSETVVSQQPERLASPSSVGRQYRRRISPSFVAVTSPDFKWQPVHSRVAKSSQSPVCKSPRSCDTSNQIPAHSPKQVISSSCVHLTKCDVNAAETYSEMMLSSDTCGRMKNASDRSPCSGGKAPKSDKQLPNPSPPFSSTFSSTSKSAQPHNQSVNKAEGINGSDYTDSLMSALGKSHPHFEDNMSRKRKKSSKDKDVTSKSCARKRPHSQLHLDSYSPTGEQDPSTISTDVYSHKQSAEVPFFTALSFGCDVETHDDTGQTEKLNSEVLRHLGSSGVESESSSNDVDLMITRKYLLDRKRSSGFQSLGHISEAEFCPSPVFPTISKEAVVDLSDQTGQHTAINSTSASPVFGKRQTPSFAAESPCLSLSGSGRKSTPVPGCTKSFSPDVSQNSIAHLMTSPLLDGSDTLQKTSRSRPSTRRCLDQQMHQSGKRLSVSRHSSSKLTEEDN